MSIGENCHACVSPEHNHGSVVVNFADYATLTVATGRVIGDGDFAETVLFTQDDVDAGLIASCGTGTSRRLFLLTGVSPITWSELVMIPGEPNNGDVVYRSGDTWVSASLADLVAAL